MAISRVFLTPLIVACALFMENMDATVIATSLPAMARDMGESPIALKLAMTSYLVSLAVFIPISGWMADRFGARTVFRTAIGVFMFGSILCGMSHTLAEFVAARFFQGIGGAMMVPVGRLVILRTVSKADLVKALSYLTIPALLGPVIGPRSVDSSLPIFIGAGYSLSTFRSASSVFISPIAISKTCAKNKRFR